MEEPEDDGPDETEIRAAEKAHADDLVMLQKLIDADVPLGLALGENKRLNLALRKLEERMDGLIAEKDAAIGLCKSWQRKYERSQRQAA